MDKYKLNNKEKTLVLYGYEDFFKTYKFKATENDDYLIVRGSYLNYKIAEKCKDIIEDYYYELNSILLSNNMINYPLNFNYIYYDFHYPNYETCKFLKQNGCNVNFVAYINKWYNLVEYQVGPLLYSYCLYTKNLKRIQNENKDSYFTRDEIDEKYYFKNLNTIMNIDENYEIEEEDFENETIIKYRKFNKNEIINNYDIAKCCFEHGDVSNLVLSKLITCNPNKYEYLLEKYNPFLLYTRNKIKSMCLRNGYFNLNICYINILNNAIGVEDKVTGCINVPEFNLYKLAKKYRNKQTIDKIMELYHKNDNKLIKILDIENERYVYEEIREIPYVQDFNPIKGDELNPYNA